VALNISKRSRLRFKEFLEIYGVSFWEMEPLPEVPEDPNDLYYLVKNNDRIDLLASTFYGDPNLWWVIAGANDMNILPTDLQPGRVIRIPSPIYVSDVLFTRAVET
jgi:hypothetical protein